MPAQTCVQTASEFGSACPAPPRPHAPVASPPTPVAVPVAGPLATGLPASHVGEPMPSRPAGVITRLWRVYRSWRADRILRNLADELDAHMLKDMGAPEWVVNQARVEQSLKRIARIDTLRW